MMRDFGTWNCMSLIKIPVGEPKPTAKKKIFTLPPKGFAQVLWATFVLIGGGK